jgi:hypothetical protein
MIHNGNGNITKLTFLNYLYVLFLILYDSLSKKEEEKNYVK